MLQDFPLSTSIVATDLDRAKRFYIDTLGLKLISEDMVLFLQGRDGATLMIYPRDNAPTADHTLVHWWVTGIDKVVDGLKAKGVKFERYPGMEHDERGISQQGEHGPRAAWFKDPDGNILAVMEKPT